MAEPNGSPKSPDQPSPWGWLLSQIPTPPAGGPLLQAWPRVFPFFLLLFGVGMILISLVGDQGLIAYYNLRQEAQSLRQDVERLKQRKAHLLEEVQALRGSEVYLESLARRQLGLVRPEDTIIQLPPLEALR